MKDIVILLVGVLCWVFPYPMMLTVSSAPQSTLLSTLTKTQSECASYEFTTLTCIPGVIEYNGANIQLLDLPGIIEGAAQGKGRGRQVSRPRAQTGSLCGPV